jgi:cytochrome c peroxidase
MRLAIAVFSLWAPICLAADPDVSERSLKLPLGLQHEAAYLPADNPQTAAKVALGKQLFFDPRLSRDQSLSCASCHDPEFAFTDGKPVSHGINDRVGRRSAPTLVNRLFSKEQFWDGRAADLEAQTKMPITDPDEMGSAADKVVQRIRRSDGYRRQFSEVFGGHEITFDQIAEAIAAFERTLLSGDAAFDRFAAGDSTAIDLAAMRGVTLFKGKAQCFRCHAGFNFTDESFRNVGVATGEDDADLGRFEVSGAAADRGAFKTPTLRDVARTAPYFHDGSASTLTEVVDYYDRGGIQNPNLAPEIKPLHLSAREKADLVAFLESLTGSSLDSFDTPVLPE